MVNFLFQYSKKFKLNSDDTYTYLNHYDYNVKSFKDNKYRIDFLTYKNFDISSKYYENKKYIFLYLGYVDIGIKKTKIKNLFDLYLSNKLLSKIVSGKFIFVIFDKKNKKLKVINDKFGFLPLFYYSDKNSIIISTEAKGIIKSRLVDFFKINYISISNYLNYEYILGNKFYLKEINKLPPASILNIDKDTLFLKRYSNLKFEFSKKQINFEKLKNKFRDSIKSYKKIGGDYICDISGGYDSRFIYLMDKNIKYTMTIGNSNQKEFKIVKDTLNKKESKLINLKYNYHNNTMEDFKNMNYIMDGLIFLYSQYQNYLINKLYQDYNFKFYLEGFLGDGILGGLYLRNYNEYFLEFGFNKKYKCDEYKNIKNFNNSLLTEKYFKYFDKIDDISKEYLLIDNNLSLRKKIILWKFYNRGLNWLLPGSVLRNKQLLGVYPFFYYPFFDEYKKYDLNLLHLKKLYTYLLQYSLNKKYLKLKDDYFNMKFKYPYKLRLINSLFYRILTKLKIYNPKYFVNGEHQINLNSNSNLKKELLDIIINSKINYLFNLKYVIFLFKKENAKLFSKNYRYILRIVNLCIFFNNYEYKIIF